MIYNYNSNEYNKYAKLDARVLLNKFPKVIAYMICAGVGLENISVDSMTEELVLYILGQNGGKGLKHVPFYKRTPAIVLLAISLYGPALGYLPRRKRTLKLIKAAMENDPRALQFVSDRKETRQLVTYSMILAAVKQNGWVLKFVPEDMKTYEVVLAAVKQNGWALKFAPADMWDDYDIVLTAVKSIPHVLYFASERLKNNEDILRVVNAQDPL